MTLYIWIVNCMILKLLIVCICVTINNSFFLSAELSTMKKKCSLVDCRNRKLHNTWANRWKHEVRIINLTHRWSKYHHQSEMQIAILPSQLGGISQLQRLNNNGELNSLYMGSKFTVFGQYSLLKWHKTICFRSK